MPADAARSAPAPLAADIASFPGDEEEEIGLLPDGRGDAPALSRRPWRLGAGALSAIAAVLALRSVPVGHDSPGQAVILDDESSPCTSPGDDCRASQCCKDPSHRCFEKNHFWATCKASCDPGVDANDLDTMPWSCRMLGVDESWAWHEERARGVMEKLSLADKVSLLRGENDAWPADRHGYAGYVGVGRKYMDPWMPEGIMPLSMNDGPQGYNSYERFAGKSTQFPSLLTVAASFSTSTARRYAGAIADEFVAKGANVLLGPDVEVTRAALTGRSFETLSGEDPFLGSQLVQAFVKAVQDRGIIACVKHFLDNNQEIYRQTMNVEVSDRAQHEIYLPVFKAAFDAGAAAVMCSYNKVYGQHACENHKLLTKFLRDDLGFRGFVLSDWGATHDALRSAKAGLDIDMQMDDPKVRLPDEYHKLPALLKSGDISMEDIDKKVLHVLSAMHVAGQFDGRFTVPDAWPKGSFGEQRGAVSDLVSADATSAAHRGVAFQTIVDGAVLLKNARGALPLSADSKIVFVGKYCDQATDPAIKQGSVYSGGGSGYVATDKSVTPLAGFRAKVPGVTASVDAAGAAGADVAVVCAAAHSEEGWDRKELALPEARELVTALRKQGPDLKIVVLASVPGAVTTDWIGDADAALMLFMPGEMVGPAAAALLLGKASPGGRLPVSFPQEGEKRFTQEQYPGTCPPPNIWCSHMTANFSEGVLVGYRWNDAPGGVPAAFPFGFGLTYTDFKFEDFGVSCKDNIPLVSFNVTNIGDRDGDAVPQLYVGFKRLAPVVRQLRSFQKVHVARGKHAPVSFQLRTSDWSVYDEGLQRWVDAAAEGDVITVSVGKSSTDLVWHSVVPAKCVQGLGRKASLHFE
uniref:Probable beta-glucosidase G n=1 Tax=Zooxanthella nutricula TaxID=1333877 RepID=A0A6U9BDF8_9DINO